MAMTFTLVAVLKDKMTDMIQQRVKKKADEEKEKERREIEVPLILSQCRSQLTRKFDLRLRKREHEVHLLLLIASKLGNPSSIMIWRS